MNRVDEALRRTRELTDAPTATDYAPVDRVADSGDGLPLDMFPVEQASPAERPVPRIESPRSSPAFVEEAPADGDLPLRINPAYADKIVGSVAAHTFSTEQYRRLAAAIHHLQVQQGLNRLMVSSAVPREGKTLTLVNLALTFSESYQRRVLLIDADLRRPSIHQVFGIANIGGLSEVLRSQSGEVKLTHISPRLSVMPAGMPHGDPMTTLASARMTDLLDDLGSQFDWILLDAPPVTLMADAGLLVRLTGAVVLVIAAGSTPYAVVEKAVAELGREHIVGTVLNRIEGDPAEWAGYYGSGDAGKKTKKSRAAAQSLASADRG